MQSCWSRAGGQIPLEILLGSKLGINYMQIERWASFYVPPFEALQEVVVWAPWTFQRGNSCLHVSAN